MTATPPPKVDDFMEREDNLVMFPLSQSGYSEWHDRSVEDIRAALKAKVVASPTPSGNPTAMSDTSTILGNESMSKQSV